MQLRDTAQIITRYGIWFGGPFRREEKGSKAQTDLWARVLRAVYRYAYDSYRDKDSGGLLPDPPTTVLSTKMLWNGNTRKTTKIRNNDLGRWLKALDTVRQWAIAGYKTDVLMGVEAQPYGNVR